MTVDCDRERQSNHVADPGGHECQTNGRSETNGPTVVGDKGVDGC